MSFSKLSIIIPTYNEERTIKKLLDKVKAVKLKNIEKEIILIDDGSKDNTINIINKFNGIKLIKHSKNKGKGAAIRTGIKHVTGDIVIIQDADLEYDPSDYNVLIEPIIEGKAKVVYGSRNLKKRDKLYSGISFYIGGAVLTWLTNLLYRTNITDEPTCYKVFKADLLKSINLKCERFEFCPEVTAKIAKRKIKIYDVPIAYYPRSIKEGKKINWKDGVEAILTLIKYRFVD